MWSNIVFPLILFIAIVSQSLSGCVSLKADVQPASETYTLRAKRFEPPPDRVGIYIIRQYDDRFGQNLISVSIDHSPFGALATGTFLYAEFLPRTHIIELSKVSRDSIESDLLRFATTEKGRCYFFLASTVSEGDQSGSHMSKNGRLKLISELEGRSMVSEYKASGDNTYDSGDSVLLLPSSK